MQRRTKKAVQPFQIPTKKDPSLKWALYYHSIGWHPFPLDKEKVPYVKVTPLRQGVTIEQIQEWWGKWPRANLGILTGKVSNLYVLDIDSKEAQEKLKSLGDLPTTPTVLTSRGVHYYLKKRDDSPGDSYKSCVKGKDWDFKGDPAYVVAPPSTHSSGKQYEWDLKPSQAGIAPLPHWLVNIIEREEQKDMVEAVDQQIEELMVKEWKEGQRDALALGLTGWMYKYDWPEGLATRVLENICSRAKDEESKSRLQVLKNTYEKGRKGQALAGRSVLEHHILTPALEKLEFLLRKRQIPMAMRQIDDIRRAGLQAFERDRRIGIKITQDLKEQGTFLNLPERINQEAHWFDKDSKILMGVESSLMETKIDLSYGINPAEELSKKVTKHLRSIALEYGQEARVYRGWYYDLGTQRLYIYRGEGEVYRLDGEKIEIVPNSTDGLYLEGNPGFEPFKADLDNPISCYDLLIKDLSFDISEEVRLAEDLQRTVLWLWFRSLFFIELQPTKPLLTLIGDPGSGKTSALRRMLKLLCGASGDVSRIKDKNSWTSTITNRTVLVLDDITEKHLWMSEYLNTLATGQSIEARVYFTTNDPESYRPRCFGAMTTIQSPFTESTTADRMILLRMTRLGSRIPEHQLNTYILERRDRLWGDLLTRLNKDIQLLQAKDSIITFRMADWASLADKLLREQAEGDRVLQDIIGGLEKEQMRQVIQGSIIPEILKKWDPIEDWCSAAQLYQAWRDHCQEERIYWGFKSAATLGRHLVNIREALITNGLMIASQSTPDRQMYLFKEKELTKEEKARKEGVAAIKKRMDA